MQTNKAQFNFNDVAYCVWYDGEYERADYEGENIDIDTVKARKINAKRFVDFLNDELKTEIVFNDLYMPKYYNFEDDQLVVSYSNDDLKLLKKFITANSLQKALVDKIKDYTTSCSGYTAFYTKEQLMKNDDLVFRVMLETILENGLNDGYDFYFDRHCIYDELHNECVTFNED
jgi:hypothetical protein